MEQSNNFLFISNNLLIIIDKILYITKCDNINSLNIYLIGKDYPIIIEFKSKEETDKAYNELIIKITNLKKLQYETGKR